MSKLDLLICFHPFSDQDACFFIIFSPAEPVYVTSCHLHYRAEPTRSMEVAWMEDDLKQIFADNCCQIWAGDFNSLTREDYDDATWESIAKIRYQVYKYHQYSHA